jgi:hypothetical protein
LESVNADTLRMQVVQLSMSVLFLTCRLFVDGKKTNFHLLCVGFEMWKNLSFVG